MSETRGAHVIAERYSLLRELGRGGSGAVWLARDESLGREVAMKRQHGAGGDREEALVWREARVAARLQHPHLVSLFDLVEDDGDLWLVMEYVAGPSLAAVVAEHGALPHDDAARIVGGVADGLRHAHAQGIVHRDVKPSNILLDAGGEPKLADFGIALMSDRSATTTLTATGTVHGSPAYLAPEVATGRGATAASDVWSLGATLFHALTGEPPYTAPDHNVVAILYRIVHEPVPCTDRAGWLQPLLDGAMTRDPARRWTLEQVREFLGKGRPAVPYAAPPTHDLEATAAFTAVRPTPSPATRGPATVAAVATPTARPRRRGPWLIAAAIVLVALVAVAVLVATRSGDSSGPGQGPGGTSSSAPPASGDEPTEAGVRAFVEEYLATAPSSPAAGFAMLTPDYQRQSGGLSGYESFWGEVGAITSIGPVDVRLDPLQATYTYSYTRRHEGKVTETVTLDLVQDGGRYLIDGGTSHRP